MGFSGLRERVVVADGGRFNCHFGELADRFVRRTANDGAGGSELTLAGEQVVGALLAGTYTAPTAIEFDGDRPLITVDRDLPVEVLEPAGD